MSDRESMEIVIRSVDDAIFTSDTGDLLDKNSIVGISGKAEATIVEKKMSLDGGLYFLFGMAVAVVADIGKDVLTGLISDWIKERIQKWNKPQKQADGEKPVVILIFDTARIEFRIKKGEVQITHSRR